MVRERVVFSDESETCIVGTIDSGITSPTRGSACGPDIVYTNFIF